MANIRPISGKVLRPSRVTNPKSRLLSGGQIEEGFLYVTDGELVARFPVNEVKTIGDGYLPREALLHIERDGVSFHGDEEEVAIGKTPFRWTHGKGNGSIVDGVSRATYSRDEPVFDPREPRQFPVLAEEWAGRGEAPSTLHGGLGCIEITLDTKALRSLALAMGLNKVRIEVDLDSDQRPRLRGHGEVAPEAILPWEVASL